MHMTERDADRRRGWLDDRLARFDDRLKGILGEGRIPRREKRAKAEEAIQAVNELIDDITDDVEEMKRL